MSGHMVDFGWESVVLLRIFLKCDVYSSERATISNISSSREVEISRVIESIENNLLNTQIDLLPDLQRTLELISKDGFISWEQFKKISRRWIVKLDPLKWEEGRNNFSAEKEISNVELHRRLRQVEHESTQLREEIAKAEDLTTVYLQQRDSMKRKLNRCLEKCRQLEIETDDHREAIAANIEREKAQNVALYRSQKECKSLQKRFEAAKEEIQDIALLRSGLKEKAEEIASLKKQITDLERIYTEKYNECINFQTIINQLTKNNHDLLEFQEERISNLEKKNTELINYTMEIQSFSMLDNSSFYDESSDLPIPNIRHCMIYEKSHNFDDTDIENSLHHELKISGFTTECSRNDSRCQELEEELNNYDEKISIILERVNCIVETLVTNCRTKYLSDLHLQKTVGVKTQNIETLNEKTSVLSHMVAQICSKFTDRANSSTQVDAELFSNEHARKLGIRTFDDAFKRGNCEMFIMSSFMPSNKISRSCSVKRKLDLMHCNGGQEREKGTVLNERRSKEMESLSTSMLIPLSCSTPVVKNVCNTYLIQRSSRYSGKSNKPFSQSRFNPYTNNYNTIATQSCATVDLSNENLEVLLGLKEKVSETLNSMQDKSKTQECVNAPPLKLNTSQEEPTTRGLNFFQEEFNTRGGANTFQEELNTQEGVNISQEEFNTAELTKTKDKENISEKDTKFSQKEANTVRQIVNFLQQEKISEKKANIKFRKKN